VLNEPENSLHPDLIAPLARLIGTVSEQTQVWVIAHDDALIAGLQQWPGCRTLHLQRDQGASVLVGQTVLDSEALVGAEHRPVGEAEAGGAVEHLPVPPLQRPDLTSVAPKSVPLNSRGAFRALASP